MIYGEAIAFYHRTGASCPVIKLSIGIAMARDARSLSRTTNLPYSRYTASVPSLLGLQKTG